MDPELPRLHSDLEDMGDGESSEFLTQRVTPPKVLSSLEPLQSKQKSDGAVDIAQTAMSNQRYQELTTLISRAFRAQDAKGEGILSKQALTKAVENSGTDLAMGELDEALMRLDASNKVMLSDDLVFCV